MRLPLFEDLATAVCGPDVAIREKQIGGSGGSLGPPGPLLTHLLTHLHTGYMVYSECLPTRLNPLAERTCFSQVAIVRAMFFNKPKEQVPSLPTRVACAKIVASAVSR
jgi:hypothetical protein